jgi:hypothetical protein
MASTTEAIISGILSPLTIEPDKEAIYLEKWRNLLYEAAEIELGNIGNDLAWPYLFRLLIAYLVVRDIILDASARLLLMYEDQEVGSSSGSSSGGIKRIETGPTNVERYDKADSISSIYKIAGLGNGSGFWDDMMSQICGLAQRLQVKISGCKHKYPVNPTMLKASDYSYEQQYPVTPITERK